MAYRSKRCHRSTVGSNIKQKNKNTYSILESSTGAAILNDKKKIDSFVVLYKVIKSKYFGDDLKKLSDFMRIY